MNIGLIGLPQSGKTTVFQALSGSAAGHVAKPNEPHLSTVTVPDERVDRLAELYKSRKIVHATVQYTDLPGVASEQAGKGLPEEHLRYLGVVDALLAVVRGFESAGIAPDIAGEVESIHTELIVSDMQKVENRMERIEKSIGKISGDERKAMERERAVLQIIQQSLNDDVAIRELELDDDQRKIIRGFQFLSEKPMLYLINVGEDQLADVNTLPPELEKYAGRPRAAGGQIGGQVEMEIAGLENEDREAFMQDYGIRELAAERLIRQCYDLMDYLTFFTAAEKEAHAWTITRGMKAPQAAGVIHSDFERGFIRAEVIPFDDLMELGSIPAAKKAGKLRLEGKDYVVQDGDVILFLFNV